MAWITINRHLNSKQVKAHYSDDSIIQIPSVIFLKYLLWLNFLHDSFLPVRLAFRCWELETSNEILRTFVVHPVKNSILQEIRIQMCLVPLQKGFSTFFINVPLVYTWNFVLSWCTQLYTSVWQYCTIYLDLTHIRW